ncbi:transcriptional repressor [Burkholderiaceae bacterium DAT-1]|nr:transcriptional repressor [Burkholderiaceae bacterium DAT-1]
MSNPILDDALSAADQWCSVRGEKLTSQRREVLSLLLKAEGACKAYDILAAIQKERPTAAPPTVYRALDFLVSVGLVHKLDSTQSFVPCHSFTHPHQSVMLICSNCKHVLETQEPKLTALLAAIGVANGFQIAPQHIEVHGVCSHCSEGACHGPH